ncbi:MAG: hypothetical protein HY711_10795, partial [Candidatus Melainabacteria bacterium]|nr:hypothetical protein [Candidatus Melainabacteria bacterium]
MPRFHKVNVAEMLGVTKISSVTDRQIWNGLVTPMVKSLLGPITEVQKPELSETVRGRFPGDEVTNLNDHRLFGGQIGFIRCPYIRTVYITEYG